MPVFFFACSSSDSGTGLTEVEKIQVEKRSARTHALDYHQKIQAEFLYSDHIVLDNSLIFDGDSSFFFPIPRGLEGQVLEKITQMLSFETLYGQSLESVKETWSDCVDATNMGCGITKINYVINYDQNGILDLTIYTEYLGANLSTYPSRFHFDLETGDLIAIADILDPEKMEELTQIVGEGLNYDMREGEQFTIENLNAFTIVETGMYFIFEDGSPPYHEEPYPYFFISNDELQPYILEGGILDQLP